MKINTIKRTIKTKIILTILAFAFTVTGINAQVFTTLTAPDGNSVTIRRDNFGVPHIYSQSEVGVFFGQGFAVAQDRLFQLEVNRRVAEGRTAEILGSQYLPLDMEARKMFYTEEEKTEIFGSLPPSFKEMLDAYTQGINAYIDSMNANPVQYKPQQFALFNMEEWTVNKSIAVMQYYIRSFGQFGGEELNRLQELQDSGFVWFEQNRPINFKDAPTTIKNGKGFSKSNYKYSGVSVSNSLIKALSLEKKNLRELEEGLNIPDKFGSFAVTISSDVSASGNVMLLGGPQMGEPVQNEANVVNEVELNSPNFHVGGMTIAGIPMVIIGRNNYHAWTMTSGVSDNSDIYIDSTSGTNPLSYFHNDGWLDVEVIVDTIFVQGSPVLYEHYRTMHGPVLGADTSTNQLVSLKMAFWKQELDMVTAFYEMIKSNNIEDFELAVRKVPVSFNLFYIGKDQTMKYWHTGIYQDRGDGVDPRLPHKGDGSEEWEGFISFEDLPQEQDPESGMFLNWNNKPAPWWDNGDNMPWIPISPVVFRVQQIETYLKSGRTINYNKLKGVPQGVGSHGTYQQAIELGSNSSINSNILPPGQSAFISLSGQPSPHASNQWVLHQNWQYKEMDYGSVITNVGGTGHETPLVYALNQNYPNPFNPETAIGFTIAKSGPVKILVYDVLGREVRTLVNEVMNTGSYNMKFNFSSFNSGVYFYRIQAGSFTEVKKMLLIK